jgi:hypothetical protein
MKAYLICHHMSTIPPSLHAQLEQKHKSINYCHPTVFPVICQFATTDDFYILSIVFAARLK